MLKNNLSSSSQNLYHNHNHIQHPPQSPSLSDLNDLSIDNLSNQEYSGYPEVTEFNHPQNQYTNEASTDSHSFDVGVIDECLRNASLLQHVIHGIDTDESHGVTGQEAGGEIVLDSRELEELEYSLERDQICLSDIDEENVDALGDGRRRYHEESSSYYHSESSEYHQQQYEHQRHQAIKSNEVTLEDGNEGVGYEDSKQEIELDDHDLSALDKEITRDVTTDDSGAEAFTLKEMLRDAMHELDRLKIENGEWMQRNENHEHEIETLKQALHETKTIHLRTLQEVTTTSQTKLTSLESQIQSLTSELTHLRSAQQQVSTIRQSIQEEKDLDILNLRVQLMSEKESQLRDLKSQMEREKESASRQLRNEILQLREEFDVERREVGAELNKAVREKEDEAGRFQKHLQALKEEFDDERNGLLREVNGMRVLIENLRNVVTVKSIRPASRETGVQTEPDMNAIEFKSVVEDLAAIFGISPDAQTLHIKNVIVNYLNDMESKIDALTREITGKDTQIVDLNKSMSELEKRNKEWETNHATTLLTLQQSHDASINSLKQSYDHQIASLSAQNASLMDPTAFKTWMDVESRFPYLFAAFRADLQKQIELNNAALFQCAQESVDQEKTCLKAFFEQSLDLERERLRSRYDQDIFTAKNEIKETCAVAYEAAVKKLKTEYVKLEQRCLAKFEQNSTVEEDLRTVIKNQEAYISTLESSHSNDLEALKLEYSDLVTRIKDEARIQYSNQLRQSLEKMKQKYVEALRKNKST
ncbi:UNVERIFIED_CONTAM: hypothetical protein HDU68_000177 [Siphonaria sp. JEL0065]|nr:hypothetical protein HDU68_000177 [Siphonaria sp. JEL0065]